jgi:hypothetical protein
MAKRKRGRKKGIVSGQFTDYLIAGLVKSFTEPLLANYIGNANLVSGAVKIGIGYGVQKFIGGNVAKYIKMAMLIDGAEDIVYGLFRGGLQAQGQSGFGVVV